MTEKQYEFFVPGLVITHDIFDDFEAIVESVDRENNKLHMKLCRLHNDYVWYEDWDLGHTETGIRCGEYKWNRSRILEDQS